MTLRAAASGAITLALMISMNGSVLAQDPPESPTPEAPEQSSPVEAPPASMPDPATEPASVQTPPPTDLPDAKALLDESIAAMGGRAAFDKIESTRVKCRIVSPQVGEGTLDLFWMKPNKVFIRQSMAGMESTMGSDGVVAWLITPVGPQILDNDAARELRQQANMFRMVLHFRDDMKSLQTQATRSFSDTECFQIAATDDNDNVVFVYVSQADRLLQGIEQAGDGISTPTTYRFSDWKEASGLKYFTKIEIEQRAQSLPLVFEEVEFNAVDESVFTLPDDIAAMLKAREEAPTTSPSEPVK